MAVKDIATKHYIELVENAGRARMQLKKPPEGWVATMRKALQMSGAQLARRCGISRDSVSKAQRNEVDGKITVGQLERLAEAMEAEFVYAIVPKTSIKEIERGQAVKIANNVLVTANTHMGLEDQSVSDSSASEAGEKLMRGILGDKRPRNFWDEN